MCYNSMQLVIDAKKIIDKESLQFNQFSFRKTEDREVDHHKEETHSHLCDEFQQGRKQLYST